MAPITTASRSFWDPKTCRLPCGQRRNSDFSPLGHISKYLKVVPVEGKGLGVVATQDIAPWTLLLSEAPAAIAEQSDYDRAKEVESITEAYRGMSPAVRARFDGLYEAPLQLATREARIWMTNALYWPTEETEKYNFEREFMAVFIDMARVNHSCVPNAERREHISKNRMHLTSTRTIRAGEEVTMCWNDEFYYKTAGERNEELRWTYCFTCTFPACTDESGVSDQRRQMLKQVWYCDMNGWPAAPDFSVKLSSYEEAVKLQADTQLLKNNRDIPKPKMNAGVIRRAAKLEWDEGLINVGLIKFILTSASAFLLDLDKRREAGLVVEPDEYPNGKPFLRNMLMTSTSECMLRLMFPPGDKDVKEFMETKAFLFFLFTSRLRYENMSVDDCDVIIKSFMGNEPNPLTDAEAYA